MKKRLLSTLTLICILTSLFVPMTTYAAASNAYFTGGYNYPTDQSVGGWKNLYGEIYSAAGFDYVFAGVRYASGTYKEQNVPNCTATVFNISGNYYNISKLDSQLHLSQLPQGVYYYQVEVRDKNGNYIQLLPNGRIYFNVGGAAWPTEYFDLNARLDGAYVGNTAGFGTADVYINGSLVANDVTDYYASHRYGTTFEVKDIRAKTGYTYNGVYSGNVSGMLGDSWFKNYVELSFTKNTYKLTVNSENTTKGTVTGTGSYKYGSTATIAATPKTGYSFSKWDDGNTNKSRTVTVSGNKTYTAYFTAHTYTVKYNGNGATSGSTASSTHTYNTAKALTANGFSRTGYTFLGWSTSSSATSATYSNKQSVTNFTSTNGATINLYAVWQKNNYTLKIRPNGGKYKNGSGEHTGETSYVGAYGASTGVGTPTRDGYTFVAWGITGAGSIAPWGKSTLITCPYFTDKSIPSIYNNEGNGSVTIKNVAKSGDCPTTSAYMTEITTLGKAQPGLGGFVQVTNSKQSGVFYHIILAKIPVGYYLQTAWNPCGGGNDEEHSWVTPRAGTGKWETYIYKTQCSSTGTNYGNFGHVFLTKDPNMVWKVNHASESTSTPVTWYVAYANMLDATGISSSSKSFTYGAGTAILTAMWRANKYTIKYNGNGATSGSMNNSTHVYDTAKDLAANSYVRDGYEFLGWSTDSSVSAVAKYSDKQSVLNLSATNDTVIELYAVWKKIPETSGVEFSETSYYGGKKLTLVSGTSGAKIYYTTDGSTPTTSSKVYSEPLDFNTAGTFVVKAFAHKENYITSAVTTSEPVVVGITDAKYAELIVNNESIGKSIALTNQSDTVKVYYTEDGNNPTTNSSCYNSQILYTDVCDKTINTMAVSEGCVPSNIMTTKLKVEKVATPIIEIFEDYPGGATIKISCATSSPDGIYYSVYGLRTGNGSVDPLTSGMSIKKWKNF